jgi:hypothetical protein
VARRQTTSMARSCHVSAPACADTGAALARQQGWPAPSRRAQRSQPKAAPARSELDLCSPKAPGPCMHQPRRPVTVTPGTPCHAGRMPAAGAPRMDAAAPFAFKAPHKRVNWRRLRGLSMDRLTDTADAATGAAACTGVPRPAVRGQLSDHAAPPPPPSLPPACLPAVIDMFSQHCHPPMAPCPPAVMDMYEDIAYGDLEGESAFNLSEANLLKVRPGPCLPAGIELHTCKPSRCTDRPPAPPPPPRAQLRRLAQLCEQGWAGWNGSPG